MLDIPWIKGKTYFQNVSEFIQHTFKNITHRFYTHIEFINKTLNYVKISPYNKHIELIATEFMIKVINEQKT